MNLSELLQMKPKLHTDGSGQPYSWQVGDDMLRIIDSNINEHSSTLETGAGVSTVLFALKGANHICVVPDEGEVARIKTFCYDHQIPLEKMRFEIKRSECCLPTLQTDRLDLILIDGAHGFPNPFIDWFYTAGHLRVGGLMLIDDTHLWTAHTLKMFLKEEPEWQLEAESPPRSVAFRKIMEIPPWKNEGRQPFVARETVELVSELYPDWVDLIRPYFSAELFRDRKGK